MYTHTHTHTYTHIYIYIHTHIYIHIFKNTIIYNSMLFIPVTILNFFIHL